MRVEVHDNQIESALKTLKKGMLKDGLFKEMKKRAYYEKPSVKRKRKQAEARKTMEANGVQFTDPSEDVLTAARKAQQADAHTLIKEAKLSPDVVKAAEDSVNGTA